MLQILQQPTGLLNCPYLANLEVEMAQKYYKKSLKFTVLDRIRQLPGNMILRENIEDMGSPRQISRCLAALVEMGELVKIGHGSTPKPIVQNILIDP